MNRGWAAIQENVVCPAELAREGIEGTTLVYAHIGKDGTVIGTRIVKSPHEAVSRHP